MYVIYGYYSALINDYIDHYAQIVVMCHWLGVFGYSWLSRLVCPSLGCVHYSDIFSVFYYKMVPHHILALFPPLEVCTCLTNTLL